MKNLLLLTALISVSTFAVAKGGFQDNNQAQQGFVGQNSAIKDVRSALNARDDAPIILVGSIVKQIDSDEFIFKDSTGQVKIEVSKNAWNGQTITPNDVIQIQGKVDRDRSGVEIDVKHIIKQ